MQEYLNQVRHLQSGFDSFSLHQIPKSRNTRVDSLATHAKPSTQNLPRIILVEDLCNPAEAKREKVQIHQLRVGPSWMDPIVLFLKDDILPEEKRETDKVWRKAPRFWLFQEKSYISILFRIHICCASTPKQWSYSQKSCMKKFVGVIQEIDPYLTKPLLRDKWLNMQRKAQEYVKKCDQCQKFSPNIHQPESVLKPLSSL